jgi:hypothetical protein
MIWPGAGRALPAHHSTFAVVAARACARALIPAIQ